MIIVRGKKYYTSKDAAKLLGISLYTLKNYINKGIIPQPPQVIQGLRRRDYYPSKYISNAKSLLQNYRNTKHNLRKQDGQVKKEIEKIIGHMQCSKDFKCAYGGFENLCLARDCGMEHYLECLEANPLSCKFVIVFGKQYYCQCPLRVYIAKQIEK